MPVVPLKRLLIPGLWVVLLSQWSNAIALRSTRQVDAGSFLVILLGGCLAWSFDSWRGWTLGVTHRASRFRLDKPCATILC